MGGDHRTGGSRIAAQPVAAAGLAPRRGTGPNDQLRADRAPRPRRPGRRRGADRKAARGGQAHRPRAGRPAPRPGVVRRGRRPGHPPLPRLRDGGEDHPRRRRGGGLRHHRRPAGLPLRPGLHRLRRLAVGDQRAEDLQGDGPGGGERRAAHRPQRLRRGAHPGGGGVARRLRRHLPAQHPGLRGGPPDQRHHGAVRRRRGLLAGDHRLRLHGRGDQLHVRHRPRGHPHGDPRGGDQGGAGGRRHPQREERRGALHRRQRRRLPGGDPRAALLPAQQQPRRAAAGHAATTTPTARTRRSTRWSRPTPTSPTTSRS